jgi:D-alanine-D-alanine ligase
VDTAAELSVVLVYGSDPAWDSQDRAESDRESRRLACAMRRQGHSVSLLSVCDADLQKALSAFEPDGVLVFNWCEGLPGVHHSEALVAETLEKLRFTYTGASARTLRLCYDKGRVKRRLQARGVPTPRWMLLSAPEIGDWDAFPAIVKPSGEHCSMGVDEGAVVADAAELRQRISYVLDTFRQPALVEEFIDGREFHVALWGNQHLEMLPPVEMDFSAFDDVRQRLCTHDAKFAPSSEAYQKIKSYVPARLTADEMSQLEEVSKAAYRALDCRDYGRIDVRLHDGVFYVIDINPNADISADASLALAAGKAGYCYGRFGSRVLDLAAERHPQIAPERASKAFPHAQQAALSAQAI